MLQALFHQRIPQDRGVAADLLQTLAHLAHALKREVGVYVDRHGTVREVVVSRRWQELLPILTARASATRRIPMVITAGVRPERAVLVGLSLATDGTKPRAVPDLPIGASLEELSRLAETAGAEVCARITQARSKRDPATFIGRGKVGEVLRLCEEHDADLVIFDDELAPAQQRNLERELGRKVVDRTALVLDIFARRAQTREGRVELAQLPYLLPRLTGRGVWLSRLGGGIGTRGPGETKLEVDRRRIRQRITDLRRELDEVTRRRTLQRAAR